MVMNIQIQTPSGFQPFDGIKRYLHDTSLEFVFEDNSVIGCAHDHRFIVEGKEVFAKDVIVNQNIGKIVRHINQINDPKYFYDPINVGGGEIYEHDEGFVSHNSFIGTGDTLISAEVLLSLRAKPPLRTLEHGQLNIYEETRPGHEYIMTVDVSKGRGQDYSTFTIIDITQRPFEQVAVYRNNTISPMLFPDIIYKYAVSYNEAYVVIESNDQGTVVCNGLYYDLEYENVHVSSATKADGIGVEITRKSKRLGCSGIKDIIEERKLNIHDEQTIAEMSTFVVDKQSFAASEGNHDDLMMNLVMFGYFATTQFFSDMTNIDLKELMFKQKMQAIEDDIVPFGFIDDGSSEINMIEEQERNTQLMKENLWSLDDIDLGYG